MIFLILPGVLIIGFTGCISPAGFNNLVSGESLYPIIEDSAGTPDQNTATSKVILIANGEHEPVDIENISSLMIQELNTRSIQINSEIINNNKSSEKPQNNEVVPAPVEDDAPPPEEVQDLHSLEIQVFNMLNHIRAQKGLQSLNLNQVVSNIARLRSTDMVNRNYFSHYTPEGKHTTDILAENGVMYASSGEILFKASPPSWGSPDAVMNTWLGSNIHRDIIFTPQFTQVGISIIDGGNKRVVTVIFLN